MVDVPVLIRNYKEPLGQGPNVGSIPLDTWKFTRRFTIFDSYTGISEPNGFKNGEKPKYVRWADTVIIKVTLDPTQPEKIFRPYVILSYKEKDSSLINSQTKTPASYTVEYYSDYSDILNSCLIAFICLSVLAFIITGWRTKQYSLRNPRLVMDNDIKPWILHGILYFLETWSTFMFWLLFWSSGSVFISFKLQENSFLLLPEIGAGSDKIYTAFNVILGMTLAFSTIVVLIKIVKQTSIDIYCVDFEKPNFDTKTVNAWRHVFITNEFNELQTSFRYIEPETTLIWFVWFWIGFGW